MPETDIFRVRPSVVPSALIAFGIALLAGLLAFVLVQVGGGDQLFAILALVIVLIALFAILVVFLAYFTTEYALTTEKIHIRRGIISMYHEDIEVNRVSGVEFHQGIIARVLNYGDIIIDGDSPNSRITFRQIDDPKHRHEQIEQKTIG